MPSEAKGHELAKKSRMEGEFHCYGLHVSVFSMTTNCM